MISTVAALLLACHCSMPGADSLRALDWERCHFSQPPHAFFAKVNFRSRNTVLSRLPTAGTRRLLVSRTAMDGTGRPLRSTPTLWAKSIFARRSATIGDSNRPAADT